MFKNKVDQEIADSAIGSEFVKSTFELITHIKHATKAISLGFFNKMMRSPLGAQFYPDTWEQAQNLGLGLLDGSMDALPDDNLLKYCYDNITATEDTGRNIYDYAVGS